MNLPPLQAWFVGSLSPDPIVRGESTRQLLQLQRHPSGIEWTLKFLESDNSCPNDCLLSAMTFFKNTIKPKPESVLPQHRNTLLKLLNQKNDPQFLKMLVETLSLIADAQLLHKKWPSMMTDICLLIEEAKLPINLSNILELSALIIQDIRASELDAHFVTKILEKLAVLVQKLTISTESNHLLKSTTLIVHMLCSINHEILHPIVKVNAEKVVNLMLPLLHLKSNHHSALAEMQSTIFDFGSTMMRTHFAIFNTLSETMGPILWQVFFQMDPRKNFQDHLCSSVLAFLLVADFTPKPVKPVVPNTVTKLMETLVVPHLMYRFREISEGSIDVEDFMESEMSGMEGDLRRSVVVKFIPYLIKMDPNEFRQCLRGIASAAKSWIEKNVLMFLVMGSGLSFCKPEEIQQVLMMAYNSISSKEANDTFKSDCIKFIMHFKKNLGEPQKIQVLSLFAPCLSQGSVLLRISSLMAIDSLLTDELSAKHPLVQKPILLQLLSLLPFALQERSENFICGTLLNIFKIISRLDGKDELMVVTLKTVVSMLAMKDRLNLYSVDHETFSLIQCIIYKMNAVPEQLDPILLQPLLNFYLSEGLAGLNGFQALQTLLVLLSFQKTPLPNNWLKLLPLFTKADNFVFKDNDQWCSTKMILEILATYLEKGAGLDKLEILLSVFHKLLHQKGKEHSALTLLRSVTSFVPHERIWPLYGNTIVKLLWSQMEELRKTNQNSKLCQSVMTYLCTLTMKTNGSGLMHVAKSLSDQKITSLLSSLQLVLLPSILTLTSRAEREVCLTGLSYMLSSSIFHTQYQESIKDPIRNNLWISILHSALKLLSFEIEKEEDSDDDSEKEDNESESDEKEVKKKEVDVKQKEYETMVNTQIGLLIAKSIAELSKKYPGSMSAVLFQLPAETQSKLRSLFKQHQVQLK